MLLLISQPLFQSILLNFISVFLPAKSFGRREMRGNNSDGNLIDLHEIFISYFCLQCDLFRQYLLFLSKKISHINHLYLT